MSVIYVVKLRVETGIVVSDDYQVVFTSVTGQMIKSFAEVVHESNVKFLVGGGFKLHGKAVGGFIFVFV